MIEDLRERRTVSPQVVVEELVERLVSVGRGRSGPGS